MTIYRSDNQTITSINNKNKEMTDKEKLQDNKKPIGKIEYIKDNTGGFDGEIKMLDKYVVSLVWVKNNGNGSVSIANTTCTIDSDSEGNAFSETYESNKKSLPEYALHSKIVFKIK